MNIHEYQAKQLFSNYGIPVPHGDVAFNVDEAREVAMALGCNQWMVKAQVHAGGRGQGGGVKKVDTIDDVKKIAGKLLGTRLVTHQTNAKGQPIHRVLIEETTKEIKSELYLSMLVDRDSQRIAVISSSQGGMDIEAVAMETPDKIHQITIDPDKGLQTEQSKAMGVSLHLNNDQTQQLGEILAALYQLFIEKDLSLVEINPLIVNGDGELMALDAKVTIDDSALFRHEDLVALYDASQGDEKEQIAAKFELNYIALDGDIACMVNGAGLAMATLDLIKLHGGEPANFLDVGGTATAERVAEAFKLIISNKQVKTILVNIFGGIVRCDLIAQGIIQAVEQVGIDIPVVVRLEGTNVNEGKALLNDSDLAIITSDDLTSAAKQAIQAAGAKA